MIDKTLIERQTSFETGVALGAALLME